MKLGHIALLGTVGLLDVLALGACGGGTASSGPTTTASRERQVAPCDAADALRLTRNTCWSPVGSRWTVVADAPSGRAEFVVELLDGGRARSTDHPTSTPGVDEWSVDRAHTLRIFLADRFVEYRGEVTNGSLFVGTATNVRGDSWNFRARRLHDGASCRPNELALGDGTAERGCFSAAGTRWHVTAGASQYDVVLDGNGRLVVDDGSPGNDTWEQVGGTIRLFFDDRARTLEGTVSAGHTDAIRGSGFEARRITLASPPIRQN